MNEWANMLLPAFLSGVGLGLIYFGGLWFTVRRLLAFDRVGLWMVVSFFLRNLIVLVGFYITMDGHWQRVIVSLAGFLLVRNLLVKSVGAKVKSVAVARAGK